MDMVTSAEQLKFRTFSYGLSSKDRSELMDLKRFEKTNYGQKLPLRMLKSQGAAKKRSKRNDKSFNACMRTSQASQRTAISMQKYASARRF